ncbi:MAG: TAXI family TRAP transporter solute-binding subunit [Synergistetes bacterium]|nr:TAXI family TRAP transporter solute-binding subunit [Synergistota bacterium]MCX8128018.1 TAXI family TRAP transporter solute-binding subunit [Synergistota bacterium]MDW8192787.1 TAXI family TRAP transporter solute-binding subunit [Synergistota bacterium]
MKKLRLWVPIIIITLSIFYGTAFAQLKFIVIGTGSTGGTFYPAGTILANAFNTYLKETGIKWSAQASGGSIENLSMLARKEIQMGIAGSAPATWAYEGKEMFQGKQVTNIRAITTLWPEMTQVIYRKDTGIKHWRDLKGRKVAVGPAGNPHFYMESLLKATADLTFNDIIPEYMGYGDSVEALQSRLIDAAYLSAGIPTSAVAQAYVGRVPIDMFEISDEELEKLQKIAPFYVRGIIPKGTYPGQDRDLKVAANPTVLLVEKDLPDELIYKMLEVIYIKALDEIKKQHHALTYLNLESAAKIGGIPFHKGAIKFYQDRGIKINEGIIPPEMKK